MSETTLLAYLGSCPPELVLLVIDCYCWSQQVVMGPILDDIAEVGRVALLGAQPTEAREYSAEMVKLLDCIQTPESNTPHRVRVRVAKALLTWARQSHHTSQYVEMERLLLAMQKEDVRVRDHLVYEGILHSLQRADHPSALAKTRDWRPTTSNAYAHVLRGALLAELGDPAAAIATLRHAIQILRRQQRSRPNDPELISQEAWACLVANFLHEAADFLSRIDRGVAVRGQDPKVDSDGIEGSIDKENLNARLSVLMARGYSAEDELTYFLSRLNAETMPPAPSQQNLVGFDMGTATSQQSLGAPFDFTQKILASFAWLELLERVGLPHRTSGVLFHSNEMLQAAWWARFRDTPERSTGLLLRAHRRDALKPRDRRKGPHLTGWLDRYEIATLQESTATELAQAMLDQFKVDLQDSQPGPYPKDRGEFLLEVFARFAVRVHNKEKIQAWADDLLDLHGSTAFQSNSGLWGLASTALARLIESLPDGMHSPLLIRMFGLPLAPSSDNFRNIDLHQIDRWVDVRSISSACRNGMPWPLDTQRDGIAKELILQLRAGSEPRQEARVWARLNVLDNLSVLTAEHRQEVGNILWKSAVGGGWPNMPGHLPHGTLYWPSPVRNPASVLLECLLAQPLAPFQAGNRRFSPANTNRSYGLGGAMGTVGQISEAMAFTTPSLSHVSKALQRIDEWLDAEQANLLEDIKIPEIRNALADVCGFVDKIISRCIDRLEIGRPSKKAQSLRALALAISLKLARFPVPHLRTAARLLETDAASKARLLGDAKAVAHGIATGTPQTWGDAFLAGYDLLRLDQSRLKEAGQLIFDTVVAGILMQRVISLHHALNLLACLPRHAWRRYANKRTLSMIDIALTELLGSVSYGRDVGYDSTLRESIPQIRYYAVRLAHTMVEVNKLDSPGARGWLEEAKTDPLPEIRLGRYRTNPN